jgi:acyl-CoA synthetase (AMP-forming)/AMP-acid ligase II
LNCIHEVLRSRAESSPDAIAFRFHSEGDLASEDATYAQTLASSQILAAEIAELVKPGGRVVLALEPGLHFVVALFALFEIGATAIPSFPPKGSKAAVRFATSCRNARPDLVIAEPEAAIQMRLLQEDADMPRMHWMFVDSKQPLNSSVSAISHAKLHVIGDVHECPALLQYTSGSTGTPKGAVLSHANLISNGQALDRILSQAGVKVGISWLPPYHDMGLMGAVLQSIFSGFTLHLMNPRHFLQQPLRWLRAVSSFAIESAVAPNFALEYCVKEITDEEVKELDLSRLKLLFCGSEPVRAGTLERFSRKFEPAGFRRLSLYPCYGMAEATLFVTGRADISRLPRELRCNAAEVAAGRLVEVSDQRSQEICLVSCGQSAHGHDVMVVDPISCEQVSEGNVGEIWIRGPSVAVGYFENDARTREVFRAVLKNGDPDQSYLRTGDLGAILDGELYVTGRMKEMMNLRGQNIYPHDVEATVLSLHSGFRVNGVVAFSVESCDEERLVIAAELSRASRVNSEALLKLRQDILAAVIREHGVAPYEILLLLPASIPLTTSGKVQRALCADYFSNGRLQSRLLVPRGIGVDDGNSVIMGARL